MNLRLKKYKWNRFVFLKLEQDTIPVSISRDMIKFIRGMNINGKNVIDGGSNIGLYSLYFSRCIGKKGLVYAFEMQPVIYQIGYDNAILNNKKNIISYNLALSDKSNGTVGFTEIDYWGEQVSSGGIRVELGLNGSEHCGRIQTIALDDMDIQNVGLIKLDLEGHEPKALDGMWATIDKWKPYLIIELSPGYLLDGKDEETIERIKSHGYSLIVGGDYNYFFEPI